MPATAPKSNGASSSSDYAHGEAVRCKFFVRTAREVKNSGEEVEEGSYLPPSR